LETLYESQRVEAMPWYNENFDFDLEKELDERRLLIIMMMVKNSKHRN
jgi:hypothetical protein